MGEMTAIEIKAHVPARDFELSKRFYQDLGFTLCWSSDGLAFLHQGPHGDHGKAGILLQNFYHKELAENLQMHLLVADADAWWAHILERRIPETYGVRAAAPADRDYRMRDFVIFDPCGVRWRIAQTLD